jgi:(1->4)-alpha-D-glucan 1-alpha-D-glucosylmutase
LPELRATYRLQLTPAFGFEAARSLVPYLRDLGISHLYLSPSFQSRPGSQHGYDVVDPGRLSDELGGRPEFERLAGAALNAGMGVVLDVVPNHMAADSLNRYWADQGLRERFFDVDAETGLHRRFFDIGELAGVRQEDPSVFAETHQLVFALLRDGVVDGIRIDHPDGLGDPAGYLSRLRARGAKRVWVEKILDPSERLRDWPVTGTVGYEFLNDACALFVDPAAEDRLTSVWEGVSGDRRTFGEFALDAKLEQASGTFRAEVERLDRVHPVFGVDTLVRALSSLPVYRTYVDPAAGRVEDADRAALAGLDPGVARALLLSDPAPPEFVTRFQQTTPAVMAKGVEDTAFYRYGRLLALNDVGGDPSRFGISVSQFHDGCGERARRFPLGLLTTQTHDAKRSADVRARIAALSWIPDDWSAEVSRWFSATERFVRDGAPDPVERYFLFQTLVGTWPLEVDRIVAYMEKALREAKRNTNWVKQNTEWEEAVASFCLAALEEPAFLGLLEPFCERVAGLGARIAIGQLVLKLTAPGVPDIYQGDELPFRALVDPDNRRPVNWGRYQAALRWIRTDPPGGEPVAELRKMWHVLRLLGLRARRPEAFIGAEGGAGYEPLDAGATTCAFVRGGDVLVIVHTRPGQPEGLMEAPGGRWHDVHTGERRTFSGREPIQGVVDEYGVAVFERA